MLKKVILAVVVFATSTLFGMSLSQLNSASKADLMQINGIGAKKAALILKERKSGKFTSYEDFASRVKGIGAQTAANVKGDVTSTKDVKKVKKSTSKKVKKSTSKRVVPKKSVKESKKVKKLVKKSKSTKLPTPKKK
jgi:competence protein ComEA